jgi:hypothetical protein
VEDGLGGAHDHGDVRLEERPVDPHRIGTFEHGDELRRLRVVEEEEAAEGAHERRREEQAREIAGSGAPPETGRDEDRLPVIRDAAAVELSDRRGDRVAPRVVRDVRQRECGRLDHDRRATSAAGRGGERRAREWEPERVPHGGPDVHDLVRWRRRAEDDVVVGHRDEDDTRA